MVSAVATLRARVERAIDRTGILARVLNVFVAMVSGAVPCRSGRDTESVLVHLGGPVERSRWHGDGSKWCAGAGLR